MRKNKLPPYSVASEKLVIGSLLRAPELLGQVREIIPGADAFFRPDYGALYEAVLDAVVKRPGADSDAIIDAIVASETIKTDDARALLRELAESGQTDANALLHANVVAEKSRRRSLIAIVSDIIHEAYYSEEPTGAIAQRAGERLSALGLRAGRQPDR